jgi:hypothetical protein
MARRPRRRTPGAPEASYRDDSLGGALDGSDGLTAFTRAVLVWSSTPRQGSRGSERRPHTLILRISLVGSGAIGLSTVLGIRGRCDSRMSVGELPGTPDATAGSAAAGGGVPRPGGRPPAEPPTPTDLHQLVGRALEFQGYLLRRTWGLFYLVWAAVLVVFFVLPGTLAGVLASPTVVEASLYDALQAAAIAVAIWTTWWTVARAARTDRLRDTLAGRALSRRWFLQILGVGLAITAVVVVVGFVSAFAGLLLLDASLGGVLLALLLQVRPSFDPVPPEATLATGSYAVSVVSSAIALVLTHDGFWYSSCWLIAIVVWAFAGVYALYHAPEEMTRGVDS